MRSFVVTDVSAEFVAAVCIPIYTVSQCTGLEIYQYVRCLKGTEAAQWLTFCSTNRKVAGSTPDGVIGIFH
jgi:hypothetical protein